MSKYRTLNHVAVNWNANESAGVWALDGSNVGRANWSGRPS